MTDDVLFVVTPFLPEHQPALGVSSLTAVLRQAGITASVRYFNLEYANLHGFRLTSDIGGGLPVELLIGEMVFAPALWGATAPDWATYAKRVRAWCLSDRVRRAPKNLDELLEAARPLHDLAVETVETWAAALVEQAPRILGFTTTFQQNAASLALAKAVRLRLPRERTSILFGGANCEADMGRVLSERFEFIDHVVAGEGELAITDLVRELLEGAEPRPPRYIVGRSVQDMDALPTPIFDDYTNAVADTAMASHYNLTAESSRGCWWGAKSHCTFCGLNGSNMSFRSKSAGRFSEELRVLKARYGSKAFMLADNIMDMKYLRSLIPELTARGDDVELFYETKANLKKDWLIAMAAGGVVRLQPGIESLSTSILKLMGKGITQLQNVQMLKWCEELDIKLTWNLLSAFPGEPPDEYTAMAALIPALVHLPAPTGCGTIRLDRFSPYWRSPELYGLRNVRPFWAYEVAYGPLSPHDRVRLAYFFDFDYPKGVEPIRHTAAVLAPVIAWRESYAAKAALELEIHEGGSVVRDSRRFGGPDEIITPVTDLDTAVLKILDGAARIEVLDPLFVVQADRDALVAVWLRRRWLLEENGLFLSLVIDRRQRERVRRRKIELRLADFGLADFLEPTTEPAGAELCL
jgi:ribosomal peptide maturation radical SAM protein 1